MSMAEVYSLDTISQLISQFEKYHEIFKPIFLQYNGQTQIISLQYRLRTFKQFMNQKEFTTELISQILKNPIQIPSNLYNITIYDQVSTNNLAEEEKFVTRIADLFLLNITALSELDSDFITIIIDSNFRLQLDEMIVSHISKQPRQIESWKNEYELISMLKSNQFPEKFQCLNIPLEFKMLLNGFIDHFIPKKFTIALKNWFEEGKLYSSVSRKKTEYARMFENKYGITPIEFNIRLNMVLNKLLNYIRSNYIEIIEIINEEGTIIPEIPEAYHIAENTGIIEIRFKFKVNYDHHHFGTKSKLIIDYKWMKKIFDNSFPEKKT